MEVAAEEHQGKKKISWCTSKVGQLRWWTRTRAEDPDIGDAEGHEPRLDHPCPQIDARC
jgi:hypothetical protein